MADSPIRPIVETQVMTEFGAVYEDARFYSPTVGVDHTYVEGWSEMRRARDQWVAEQVQQLGSAKKIDWSKAPQLPVRLQWARSMRVAGNQPDSTKETQYGVDGYRKVKKSDIGQPWFKSLPPGAEWVAGGDCRKGDQTLMVCDGDKAARNAARVKIINERQLRDYSETPLMVQGTAKGADPYIESKLADKPLGQ